MIDVAIINHNTCDKLRSCLSSLVEEGASEVLVFDNNSVDGSVEMVQREFPWVTLQANQTNIGYGAGANLAFAICHAPYVLLLNSDTRIKTGAIQTLRLYLDQHQKAAIVGPRLLNLDGSLQHSCYPFPTPVQVFLQESRLGGLIGLIPILKEHYLRSWSHGQERVVPWVLGAALAIRRSAFVEVGQFNPAFFMYAEEIDLCFRLRAAGWETHFTPAAEVVHVGGASTGQRRAEMAVQFVRSLVHFYDHHYSRLQLKQLTWVMKSILFTRFIRDAVRLKLISHPQLKTRISEDVTAWSFLLRHREVWQNQAVGKIHLS